MPSLKFLIPLVRNAYFQASFFFTPVAMVNCVICYYATVFVMLLLCCVTGTRRLFKPVFFFPLMKACNDDVDGVLDQRCINKLLKRSF